MPPWSPRRLFVTGGLVVLAALVLAALARGAAGPEDPSCDAVLCGGPLAVALQLAALAVGLFGAILVGMGLARLAPEPPENVEEAPPRSPPP